MTRFEPAIRFRPFSHLPGAHMLLPGSWLSCQIFPAKIVIFDYSVAEPTAIAEIGLEGFGPLEQFTVIQDLEQGHIQVSGFSKDGFLRYQIIPLESPKAFSLRFVKIPQSDSYALHPTLKQYHAYCGDEKIEGKIQLRAAITIHFSDKEGLSFERKAMPERERLFLGCTKAQDWSFVERRLDSREILPFWYWLAQSLPKMDLQDDVPQLQELAQAVHEWKMHDLVPIFLSLFQVGFKDLLVPRLFDDSYLGIAASSVSASFSPLLLLQKSWGLIRQCFFVELPTHLYILPIMPPQFHSGMLSRLVTSRGHILTIEWTKQAVRRVWVEGGCDETVTFAFQKHLKHFRLKSDTVMTLPNYSEIALQKGKRFLLDHFEK